VWKFPKDVDGWLTYEEGRALADAAAGKCVLEIGSYCGRSTICMAQTAQHVHWIDPHDGRGTPNPRDTRAVFDRNVAWHGLSDKVSEYSDSPNHWRGPFGLVFIDGEIGRAHV